MQQAGHPRNALFYMPDDRAVEASIDSDGGRIAASTIRPQGLEVRIEPPPSAAPAAESRLLSL